MTDPIRTPENAQQRQAAAVTDEEARLARLNAPLPASTYVPVEGSASAKLPRNVFQAVKDTLAGLQFRWRSIECARFTDWEMGGEGRYESETYKNIGAPIRSATLEEFRRRAPAHGIDAEKVIAELRDEPTWEKSPGYKEHDGET